MDTATERADIVLDRPPFNVVTLQQRASMAGALRMLERDPRVRVIVLRGAGGNFSSGGDIKGFLEATPEEVSQLARHVRTPQEISKPVIAAIEGYCFGVGLELALACDFRIVSEGARLALPEQRIGMIPGSGGSIRLLHMIGIARTKDMTMRSRRVAGPEAHAWGIAVACVPDDGLEAATATLVEELRGVSPLAQRTLKRLLNTAQHASVDAGIEMEGEAYGRLRSSDDFREGVASFHEKRPPVWRGT